RDPASTAMSDSIKRYIVILLLLLPGCAPWSLVGGKYGSSDNGYEVELPGNWRKQNFIRDNLTLTKDGLALQRVVIGRFTIDKDVPHTKRKLLKAMLPHDVAEVVIDDFRANQQVSNFQVIENLPVKVAGDPGFKIVYSYQTTENLKKMGAYYGALHKQWLYFLLYEAPARHYFARDQ